MNYFPEGNEKVVIAESLELSPVFCNDLYYEEQMTEFNSRIIQGQEYGGGLIIEFGGKPFGDHHASRVLPGYDPDIQASILRSLQHNCDTENVMVVNARDILPEPYGRTPKGRIRGDSKLRYDHETVRMIIEAEDVHDITIENVALAVTPNESSSNQVNNTVHDFKKLVKNSCGLEVVAFPELSGYPDPSRLDVSNLAPNNLLHKPGRTTVLMSPGGGSGKFGVAFSELFSSSLTTKVPAFAKFETFPVFNLPPNHPLNLAFEAATADLGNRVFSYNDGRTNYDKDDQNFKLLDWLADTFPDKASHLDVESPFEFSVNVIEKGILNPHVIHLACLKEIERRIDRYTEERNSGDERQETINRARTNLEMCKNFIASMISGKQNDSLSEAA
jgi:uncharacterized protein (UPF0371 family)